MMGKRAFDVIFSAVVLLLLAPLLFVIALVVKLDSPGSVFFRQVRVGRGGREFLILKFRTMRTDAPARGLQITVGRDPRITRAGHFLRKFKIDEFPQFINVLVGDMSIVGPRPEVPRYVACYPEDIREIIFKVRPGITDRASIEFRDENEILGKSADPHQAYIQEVLPIKLGYYVQYVENQSLLGDVGLIILTFKALFR